MFTKCCSQKSLFLLVLTSRKGLPAYFIIASLLRNVASFRAFRTRKGLTAFLKREFL